MLVIELNEFSRPLLEKASQQTNLPSIRKVLAMEHAETESAEKEERFGLDPWVQWVSIHTGQPAEIHNVWHLGDADKIKSPQIWEKIASMGFSYGVWGVMNAKYRKDKKCVYFFPDPWTFSEPAYPKKINLFLSLPRYYAKNYLDGNLPQLVLSCAGTGFFLLVHFFTFFTLIPIIVKNVVMSGLTSHSLFALFELISAKLFLKMSDQGKPDFRIVFLNSIAHFQHHKWPENDVLSSSDNAFFIAVDKALGIILSNCDANEPIIVINAFSQKNTVSLDKYLYRQKNPVDFFKRLGFESFTVEQLMTNDSQLLFKSEKERDRAKEVLDGITIVEKKAFQTQTRRDDKLRLFCQFLIWDDIPPGSELKINEGFSLLFFDFFKKVIKRHGSHIRNGDIFYKGIDLPSDLKNYELFNHIVSHYKNRL